MTVSVEKKQKYTPEGFSEQQSQQVIEAFAKIWYLYDGSTKVIVPAFDINRYDLSPKAKEEFKKIIRHGNIAYRSDLMAASMIEWILILLSNYKDVRIIFDNNDVNLYSPEFSDSNIISFCGPEGNYVTKKLFEEILHIDSPFVKKDEQTILKWKGKLYTPLLDKNGEMLSDYGMIYKRRSPLTDKERYIYIFAGGRAYATQGAAAALAIAGIVYEVFCLKQTRTDEFDLPVKVYSNKPLYISRDELLVSIIHPKTQSYRNHIDAVLSISFLYSESWRSVAINSKMHSTKAYTRYSNLVDKMFRESLSTEEKIEMEKLEELLDSAETQFYEPIEQLLFDKLGEIFREKTSKGG